MFVTDMVVYPALFFNESIFLILDNILIGMDQWRVSGIATRRVSSSSFWPGGREQEWNNPLALVEGE